MITRLLNEANQDANHEGFCDKEMGQSKITRNKLTETIDGLDAAVEEGKATIMSLAKDIETLNVEVAELNKAVSEATALRNDEKAKNAQTVKDAKAGQQAVAAATAVLKDFYEKAARATALLQVERPKMGSDEWKALANPNFESMKGGSWDASGFDDASAGSGAGKVDKGHTEGMQTFGSKYSGQQDSAGGVLALLEVCLSDFSTLQAETEATEAANEKAFVEFTRDSKKNIAVKTRKAEMNTADKAAAEVKLREDIADLKATQDELLAAERYYEKLVPQCIDQGQTFEERTASRASEVASLKKALEILSSSDIA